MELFVENGRCGIKNGNEVIIKPEFTLAKKLKTGTFLLAILFKEEESALFIFDTELRFYKRLLSFI